MKSNLTKQELEQAQRLAPFFNDAMLMAYFNNLEKMSASERQEYFKTQHLLLKEIK